LTKEKKLTDLEKRQIDVLLKEYEVLRGEIPKKELRIQTVISLYIAVLLGIAGYIIKEGIGEVLRNIDKSNFSIGIMLFIPIINSIFLIYSISFMYVITAQAKYTTYVIGKEVSNILNMKLLGWDKWNSHEKRAWWRARSICGVLVFILINLISFAILYNYPLIFLIKRDFILFCIWISSCIVFIYCIYSGIEFLRISKKFHEN